MGRTIIEVVAKGRTPDEIQRFLSEWFSQNKFLVRDWYSDGVPFDVHDVWSLAGVKISPNIGNIIAAKFDTGWIVFEIALRKELNGTLFHGEFYIAGWDILKGQEIDLDTKNIPLAELTRQRGYAIMSKLLTQLEEFSGSLFTKE